MTKHPCPYSPPLLARIKQILNDEAVDADEFTILDPFAGAGTIRQIKLGYRARHILIEIEPEFAGPGVHVADFLAPETQAGIRTGWFDAVVTSPVYPNGIADNFVGAEGRDHRTYAGALGRRVSEGSIAGVGRWHSGQTVRDRYVTFHEAAWAHVYRALAPGGVFILNTSETWARPPKKKNAPASEPAQSWILGAHISICQRLGLEVESVETIETRRFKKGAGFHKTVRLAPGEQITVFRKPRT